MDREQLFFTLDVETANAWSGSICQIGLAQSQGGEITAEFDLLVDPEVPFDWFNVELHGISADTVRGHPVFRDSWPRVAKIVGDAPVFHHGHFDRSAINAACKASGLNAAQDNWLDSTLVVRRFWPEFSKKGYGLKSVAEHLGFEFEHHDALEDARATAQILQHILSESGEGLEWWRRRIRQPITPRATGSTSGKIKSKPTGQGVLSGEVVVFTGALSLPRRELTEKAAAAGAEIVGSITKKVTVLVVGIQDPSKAVAGDKSSKQVKAEEALKKGQEITFLDEDAFLSLLETDHD